MCLSTVLTYQTDPDQAEEVCSNVSNFQVNGPSITFTDLFGEEHTIKGTVNRVDFVQSRIYVAV